MSSLTRDKKLIVAFLSNNTPKTVAEIANEVSLDEKMAEELIASLVDDGVIIRTDRHPERYGVKQLVPPQHISYGDLGKDLANEQNGHRNPSEGKPDQGINLGPWHVDLVYQEQKDSHFGVFADAQAFVSLLDAVSSPRTDNVSMVGIFGAWGRGKSFFFKWVKTFFTLGLSEKVDYDTIEFNAWKYQQVPAIWASLFETIYYHKNWFFRTWFTLKQNFWTFVKELLVFVCFPLFVWLISQVPAISQWANDAHITLWSMVLSFTGFLVSLLSKQEQQEALASIIKKFTKGSSFSQILGVQADIERTLASYLKTWIPENKVNSKKVLLHVEDVDRCDNDKMLCIIESLRTILEQPDIRKRLLVVITIDSAKLWLALKAKYRDEYDDAHLRNILVDYFDKLFVGSITLPEIDIDDCQRYLRTLSPEAIRDHEKRQKEREQRLQEIRPQGIFWKKKENDSPQSSTVKYDTIDGFESPHSRLLNLICDSLTHFNDLHLTPRQLNCIYYRTLLVIELIQQRHKTELDDLIIRSTLVEQILVRSYMNDQPGLFRETPHERELRMVIPYPDVS